MFIFFVGFEFFDGDLVVGNMVDSFVDVVIGFIVDEINDVVLIGDLDFRCVVVGMVF